MSAPSLHLAIACPKCGANPLSPCVNRDGSTASASHVRRTPTAPCGTFGAYQRHLRQGEKPCSPCADAKRRYMQEYRNRNPERRAADIDLLAARRRATSRLVSLHKAEFRELLAQECANTT